MSRTVTEVINNLKSPDVQELKQPNYISDSKIVSDKNIALTCPSMKRHMSNEGWQVMLALQESGYTLFGHGLENDCPSVDRIIWEHRPRTLIIQDKREWDKAINDLAVKDEYWLNVHLLRDIHFPFKLTILKDSHQNPTYHRKAGHEMGCHAWIVYYHPRIVKHLAPYVRSQHLIRTYHTIDSNMVPEYAAVHRRGALLSGAISWHYPVRVWLANNLGRLPECVYLTHPGYHNAGTHTNVYLQQLSRFKVAICTTSIYGYALRKLIEATACGCIVITDLPTDDPLPYIDGNLIRLEGGSVHDQLDYVSNLLPTLYQNYDPDKQKHYSDLAKSYYDYREMGLKLSNDIETLRRNYN